jgi:hypothetical protein
MDLLYRFQSLDGLPAIAVILTYFLAWAMLLTYLGRMLCRRVGVKNTSSSIAPAISVTGTMMSILIGLVIVSLWNDYRAARSNVAAEGTELRGATRDVQLLAHDSRPLLLADLRRYVQAVTTEEWPAMQNGGASNAAGHALAVLIVHANQTRTSSFDLRARVNRLAELRTARLGQTASGIVGILWLALLVIPIFVFTGISLLNDLHRTMHYLLAGIAACGISLAVFVALELDLPFNGIDGLTSVPISSAMDQALLETP